MAALSLEGSGAFYNQPDYVEATKRDLAQEKPLPVQYTWKSGDKIRVVDVALGICALVGGVIFVRGKSFLKVLGLSGLTGSLAVLILKSYFFQEINRLNKISNSTLTKLAQENRIKIPVEGEWKYKRITVEVDGNKVDAVIVGKSSTLNNGRWMLAANRIDEVYETKLGAGTDFMHLVDKLNCNALVLNYPGIGTSGGGFKRETAAKAHQIALKFLEDQGKGIGAKEIIDYSQGTGGWVQEDVLKNHPLKQEIKYVVIRNGIEALPMPDSRVGKFFYELTGIDFCFVSTSKTLKVPEVILSAAKVDTSEELNESSKFGELKPGIPSFAKALLDDQTCDKSHKVFIGVPRNYTGEIQDPTLLAEKVELLLKK
jgi:hypothetical protein